MSEPGDRVGPYLLERKLGEGGMGLVFEATDTRAPNAPRIAIKVMKPEAAEEKLELARFEREARLAAQMKSPHAVRLLDSGVSDGKLPYIVMELVPAHDLANELRGGHVPDRSEMITLVLHVLEALGEAHRLGIVHRDVKPSNILVERSHGRSRAKLADFGISKDLGGQRLTETGMFVGTPRYMSPEQITTPRDIDGRADLWSIGIVLYEFFAGESPFIGATPVDVVTNVLTEDPKPLANIPAALAGTIMQTLEKDRERRPRTAEELAARLAPFARESVDPLAPTVDGMVSSHGLRSAPSSDGSRSTHSRKQRRPSNRALFTIATVCGAGLAAGVAALAIPRLMPEDQLSPLGSSVPTAPTGVTASAVPSLVVSAPPPVDAPSASASSSSSAAPLVDSKPPVPSAGRRITFDGSFGFTDKDDAIRWYNANRSGLDACVNNVPRCSTAYRLTVMSTGESSPMALPEPNCSPPPSYYVCMASFVGSHPMDCHRAGGCDVKLFVKADAGR